MISPVASSPLAYASYPLDWSKLPMAAASAYLMAAKVSHGKSWQVEIWIENFQMDKNNLLTSLLQVAIDSGFIGALFFTWANKKLPTTNLTKGKTW